MSYMKDRAQAIELYIVEIEARLATLSELADKMRNLEDEIESIVDHIQSESIE